MAKQQFRDTRSNRILIKRNDVRKFVLFLFLFFTIKSNAQFKIKTPDLGSKNDKASVKSDGPAKTYIDGAETHVKNLEGKLQNANWKDRNFKTGFKAELSNLDSKIQSIKQKDPKYNTSELENKYAYFKTKLDEGVQQLADDKASEKQAKDEAEKKKEQDRISALMVKDEGITNPTHGKYIEKIVFSKTQIAKDDPNESAFTGEFNITTPIFARIYLKTSLFNEIQRTSTSELFDVHMGMVYKIFIDGNLVNEARVSLKKDGKEYITKQELRTLTSIGAELNLINSGLLSEAYIDGLMEYDSKLMVGKHTLKLDLYPNYTSVKPLTDKPIATGEFTLNVTKGFANSANTSICMPKAVKKDAAMETKYKECVKKYLVNNNKDAILKDFVLLSNDWEISKNEVTGVPISKTMYGAAGLSYKNGSCKYETFSFTQNWNGSAYSTTIETSSTGQNGNVFCDCFK